MAHIKPRLARVERQALTPDESATVSAKVNRGVMLTFSDLAKIAVRKSTKGPIWIGAFLGPGR